MFVVFGGGWCHLVATPMPSKSEMRGCSSHSENVWIRTEILSQATFNYLFKNFPIITQHHTYLKGPTALRVSEAADLY